MKNRNFASGIEFHNCNEKKKIISQYDIVEIFKQEDNKWYMIIAYNSDYCGDERECKIVICPFCGKKLC